jgi:hypothetical protein
VCRGNGNVGAVVIVPRRQNWRARWLPTLSQSLPVPGGSKGGHVARRERRKERILEVRCTFEPNRLAQACLENAYEHVVPTVRRKIQNQPNTVADHTPVPQRQAGGEA